MIEFIKILYKGDCGKLYHVQPHGRHINSSTSFEYLSGEILLYALSLGNSPCLRSAQNAVKSVICHYLQAYSLFILHFYGSVTFKRFISL